MKMSKRKPTAWAYEVIGHQNEFSEKQDWYPALSYVEPDDDEYQQIRNVKPLFEEIEPGCSHNDCIIHFTHVTCQSCRMVKTDSGWGIASRKWFKNLAEAEFYKINGRLPE